MKEWTLILTVSILVLSVTVCLLVLFVKKRKKNTVLKNSKKIEALLQLNKNTKFQTENLKAFYSYSHFCNSKRQYDRSQFDEYFRRELVSYKYHFANILNSLAWNQKNYKEYMENVGIINNTDYGEMVQGKSKNYKNLEEKLFKTLLLKKPVCACEIKYSIAYTSPKGQNRYAKAKIYNHIALKQHYLTAMAQDRQKTTYQRQVESERAKMTDSLRYDVLKRDNFRCKYCGAKASDNIKLHIDHIIPVSKGGKTCLKNLQVLCERCNMGKRDKI